MYGATGDTGTYGATGNMGTYGAAGDTGMFGAVGATGNVAEEYDNASEYDGAIRVGRTEF